MSSLPTIEPFQGISWEECSHFIRAIRATAWKEGKLRDLAWTADFASLHFSHKALTWYSRLPQDVREDWAKLQAALLDRWTPPEDEDGPRIEPTPAAAPPRNRHEKADHPPEGVLKVVIDGSNQDYYLEISDWDGRCELTANADQAVHIRRSSLSNTTLLERIDGSRHFVLGVEWDTSSSSGWDRSTKYGYLVLVNSFSLKTSWEEGRPDQLAPCTVSADGEVILFQEKNDTKMTIGTFSKEGFLFLAADPSAYSRQYPGEKKAKIFFQSID